MRYAWRPGARLVVQGQALMRQQLVCEFCHKSATSASMLVILQEAWGLGLWLLTLGDPQHAPRFAEGPER